MCVDPEFAAAVDLAAQGVDALTADWRAGGLWYAFPPPNKIGDLLLLLREQRAAAVLVVPEWPAQIWWPLLQEGRGAWPLVELARIHAGALMRASREGGPTHPLGPTFAAPDSVRWLAARVDFARATP